MASTMEESIKSPVSLLTRIRERFAHEIYQDFQEYIYERTRKPSSIVMRMPDDTVRSCFPRIWNRDFCEFCRLLREKSPSPPEDSVCVQQQEEYVHDGIIAEERGEKREWGWRTCHMGLRDFFIPIRSTAEGTPTRSILAVLIVGHYRLPTTTSLRNIHKRITEITTGKDWEKYFPGKPIDSRKSVAKILHDAADNIPAIDMDRWKKELENKIKEAVALMEIIASRTLHREILFQGETFVQSLDLENMGINIGERKLWLEVKKALEKILTYFKLDSAILYASSYNDYTDLKRQIFLPSDVKVPRALGFASYGSFEWLTKQIYLTLPTSIDLFSWLIPTTFFKTDNAIIFAREMLGGNLIVIGFGSNKIKLNAFQKTILFEAINQKVFRFLESALFGITLDHLMLDTGHLMGRAYGKAKAGNDQLKKFASRMRLHGQEDILEKAFWAIEDGVTRLELIRSNFYSFRSQRLGPKGKIMDYEETKTGEGEIPKLLRETEQNDCKEQIDIVTVMNGLKNFFSRSVRDTNLKPIQYSIQCDRAVTEGPPHGESKLRLVFLNLFDNAMKFAYEGTYIHITTKQEGNHCVIQFNNLGIGIPNDEWERVFRRLTKSRYKTPVKRTEGLGLGLSYCKRIIEGEFNGEISIMSREANTPHPRRFEGDNWLTEVTVKLQTVNTITKTIEAKND